MRTRNLVQRVACGWQTLAVPVVAALHGNVLGGGAQIALGADIRIAASGPEVLDPRDQVGPDPRHGADPVAAPPGRDRRRQGADLQRPQAERRRGSSRLGVVTRVAEDPLAAARELAAEIATKSPDAIRRGKRLFEQAWNAPAAEALALEEELQRELLMSPNQLAAVQAGMAREPASFDDPEPEA